MSKALPSHSERLEGAWSPDVVVKLECLRHGQHSAISRLEMKCQLCHDANRPGVIERRYVDAAEVERLRGLVEIIASNLDAVMPESAASIRAALNKEAVSA